MRVVIRKASIPEARPLATALARAFDDDPLVSWLLPGDGARARRLPALFGLQLRDLHLPNDEVYTTSDIAGGAVWAPPGRWRTTTRGALRALPRVAWTLRGRMADAVRTITAIEAAHPKEPHWYLALLGTEPGRRRQGIGSALLAPVLQRCDRDGTPAYLETATEENLVFYARHGFEVTRTIDVPGPAGPRGRKQGGAPTVWAMWREPRR